MNSQEGGPRCCRGNVDWIFKDVILIWQGCGLSGVRSREIQDSQRKRGKIIQEGLCLGKGHDKQQWEKQERTETKDNQLVRDGINIVGVMGTDRRGDRDTDTSRQTDPEMTGSQWRSYINKNMKALKHKRCQMQRYIVELHVSITDSKIKSPRRPAANVSNWHHLFFLKPLIYSQHWQWESKWKPQHASTLYCTHNAKRELGAKLTLQHVHLCCLTMYRSHIKGSLTFCKESEGERRGGRRFINSQSINMQSVAR